jgi:hypothetical protein
MRYYFHIRDGAGRILDREGTDLSGMAAARLEAAASARDFAIDDLRCGGPISARSIEISDEHGTILETMAVSAVLTDS